MSVQDFNLAYEVSKQRLEVAQQMRLVKRVKKQRPNPLAFLKAIIKPFNLKPAHS